MSIAIGDSAPGFTLPDTDGVEHSPADDGITAVVFTCNHCPYALAWHDRLTAAARDYPDVRFLAINPNDAERYPGDSFEAMQERVAQEDWTMPYLRDESQEVGARLRRPDDAGRLRDRRRGPAALPRRARRGPQRSEPERGLAARGARRAARRRGADARPETPPVMGCSRQVEGPDQPQIARTAAAVSLRSSSTASGSEARSSSRSEKPVATATARAPASRAARTSSGVSPTSTAPVGSPYLSAALWRAIATSS